MKKLKKIFISFGVFIAGLISKVSAVRTIEMKYGISEINISEAYSEPTIGEKISRIGRVAIPIILFVIGLFVILNKKITKKVKVIVISVLIVLAILGVMLMNYISIIF